MRTLIIGIFFLPILVSAQSLDKPAESRLHYYFTLYSQAEGTLAPSFDGLEEFIAKLEQKRSSAKNERAFVHHIFTRTHQHLLREYREYAAFSELVTSGRYNCLTGTALYALLLNHFGIDFRVEETNYHIFVLVSTSEGRVLLEATDPNNGFVADEQAITRRIHTYRQQGIHPVANDKHYFNYSSRESNEVNLDGLLGLLHYNQSVVALNAEQYKAAITHLHHALLLHRSAKLLQYLDVMYASVFHSKGIDATSRRNHLTRLENLRAKYRPEADLLASPLIR